MLPAAIAHISGELLSLACFSTMPGGMISGVLEGHRGSQVTTPFSCSATPGYHLSFQPPPSLFLVPIDSVRFLDASRSLPLPPDLHSFWIELHPFSRCFSMYCILMSFADMFRAPGFNQEAFAHTIQEIYLLRVMLVVFPYYFFPIGLLNVSC